MRTLTTLALALITTACVAQTPPAAEGPGIWRLVSLNGEMPGALVTLAFPEPGRLAGQGPCNRYFGAVEGAPPAFAAMGIGATRMACDRLDEEGRYFDALSRVTTVEMGPARMTLTGPGVRLDFATPMN
ncbi:MAG: META domain-containing protein [Gemmobacter sp.]